MALALVVLGVLVEHLASVRGAAPVGVDTLAAFLPGIGTGLKDVISDDFRWVDHALHSPQPIMALTRLYAAGVDTELLYWHSTRCELSL